MYYYLSKKREKFKHVVRRANLKRKKPFVKPSDFPGSSLNSLSARRPSISLYNAAAKMPKTEDVSSQEEEREMSTKLGMKGNLSVILSGDTVGVP